MFLHIQQVIQRLFFRKKFSPPKNTKETEFKKKYRLEKEIGNGTFGKVYTCIRIIDNKRYAVKIIDHKDKKILNDEIDILRILNHYNIITYIESFRQQKKTYIVTEYYPDSDLFDKIKDNGGRINEQKTKIIIKQLLEGIFYLHSNNIIHRDLKLSNILFYGKKLKIIDFGVSIIANQNDLLEDEIGTFGFMSPEMIQGCYNRECDIWAVGCITFIMLFGFNPFNIKSNNDRNEIYKNVLKGFRNEVLDGYGAFFPRSIKISFCARDFIVSLLTDKITRLNVTEALNHPWIIN